jgi:lipopolysaccharide transport system ATP-binding protein
MISVQNASKLYRIYDKPSVRLKEILLRGRRKYHRDFWALEDVSLEVDTGQDIFDRNVDAPGVRLGDPRRS